MFYSMDKSQSTTGGDNSMQTKNVSNREGKSHTKKKLKIKMIELRVLVSCCNYFFFFMDGPMN